MTRDELKLKFNKETGFDCNDYGYIGEYIEWLENQLIVKDYEVGDMVEIIDSINGHKNQIGQKVQLITWDIQTEPKWTAIDEDGKEYFVDETEFKPIA